MNKAYFSTSINNSMKLLNKAGCYPKINKLFLLIVAVFFFLTATDIQAQQNPDFEDISILVQIEGVSNTYNIAALYAQDGKLYVSVEELFQVLVILNK